MIWDVHLGSRILIFSIPDPGVKKAPYPRIKNAPDSGSATLVFTPLGDEEGGGGVGTGEMPRKWVQNLYCL
jgi:hypothetical protein